MNLPKKTPTMPKAPQQGSGRMTVAPTGGSGKDWLNPINKTLLLAVFRAKSERVALDGVEYIIDYERRPGYAWVSRMDGISAPCGYFDMKKVVEKEWVVTG